MTLRRRVQTPGQRISSALEISELVRSLELGVFRVEDPEASEEELRYRLAVKRYGRELTNRAVGRV